jgi:hypothetical protein
LSCLFCEEQCYVRVRETPAFENPLRWEEAAKCDRAADNDRSPTSSAGANYRGYNEGITFAVDEIVHALQIGAEAVWSSEVDTASQDVFGGAQ